MAAAHANATHYLAVNLQRIAATEDDQPVDAGGGATRQRRVVLDELVPGVRRQPEAGRGVRLVLRHLDTEQWRPIHATERFEDAALVDDGNDERVTHLVGVPLGGLNETMR